MGLSATPGQDVKKINEVIENLHATKLEFKSEEEVKEYVHEKKVEIVIIKQTAAVKKVVEALDSCINGLMAEMEQKGCLNRANFKGGVSTFTEYTVHLARTQYQERIVGSGRPGFHMEFASLSFLVSLKKVRGKRVVTEALCCTKYGRSAI